MKKLLLVAAATAALSSTALAEGESNMFYVKADVGANMMNKVTDKATGLKLKSKTNMFLDFGVGYYLMDNVRADLDLTFIVSPQLKKTGKDKFDASVKSVSVKKKGNIMALLVNGYVDVFDVSVAKIFVGGGVGMAQVKEKITYNGQFTDGSTENVKISSKKKNNFAYQLSLGASMELAPCVNGQLTYSWKDFGKTKPKAAYEESGKTSYKGHHVGFGVRFDI